MRPGFFACVAAAALLVAPPGAEGAQIALISGGLLLGPTVGYWTGGAAERGWKGLRFRGIVAGAAAAAITGICAAGDCNLFGTDETAVGSVIVVGLLGAGAIAVSSVIDIAEVPGHVRRANQVGRNEGVSLSLAPVLSPTDGGTFGFAGNVRF